MGGFDALIEPVGKLTLARQGAMPYAGLVSDAAKLPLRQFEFEQGQHGVGPGAGLSQPFDPAGIFGPRDARKPPASLVDDVRQQLRRDGVRVSKPAGKLANEAGLCLQRLLAGGSFAHASTICGRRYEFESGKPAILYELHKAA